MKLDAFCHVLPKPYADRFFDLKEVPQAAVNLRERVAGIPALSDMGVRMAQMEEFGDDYRQIINMAAPPVEDLGSPDISRKFAQLANESLAELWAQYPDRFAGFCASVPMNDVEGALEQIDYAHNELGACGIQIYTHINGRAVDGEELEPIWERMVELDTPIQVHPCRSSGWSDYPTEDRSKYEIWFVFGWEYDLSAFMARIVFSGVLERHPSLKFLIHHGGSMVPHFSGRVGPGWDQLGSRTPDEQKELIEGYPLTKRPIDYFRMFYADTALFGAKHAVRCALEFYGAERVLFASDSPYDPEKGPGFIRSTIANVDELELSDADCAAIYEGNARRLFRLGEVR